LGILYQTELNFPQSIESFEKALEKSPQYPEVNFYVGLSYFGLNQYEKALESFDKQLKIDPKYRRAHYYAALALESLGRRVEAVEHLQSGFSGLGIVLHLLT